MYNQNPKAPILKALVGNQKNLNAGLKAAIEAAAESPAKMKGDLDKDGKMSGYETARQNAIEKAMAQSPAKQVTAGEFAYKKFLKDKEMGKSTKVVDKLTSALEAPFSDKTYSELKKEKRNKRKDEYKSKK
jgi:hypothetical protein